jgi:hypothetical protein
VVLVSPGRYARLRETVLCLHAQAEAPRLELIFATPSARVLGLDAAALAGFANVEVVEVGRASTAAARALAIQRARAPIVAFTEDHAFPQPGWAAALLAAHAGPWAAVGPVIVPDRPDHLLARANHLINFSAFLEPAVAGPVADLPGRNSAYKRAVLLDYGPRLAELLTIEYVLHQDLRRRGYQLYLEPAARVRHRDLYRPALHLREQYWVGRSMAAARAREWSRPRRWVYGGAAPLIPALRLARIARALAQRRGAAPAAATAAWLLAGLASGAWGEWAGYWRGDRGARGRLTFVECYAR